MVSCAYNSETLAHPNRYHFIGIGGIGMSALAQILLQKGIEVSGSDIMPSYLIEALEKLGAKIYLKHAAENVDELSVVVYSTAVTDENPEVRAAHLHGFPFLHRSDLLSHLMQNYAPLLVTGTHGKTTTTSLLAHLLVEADLHPSFAVGGMVKSLNCNGQHGLGPYFVAEADESDGTFLKYKPFGAIITNIDEDHLDFWKSKVSLIEGFKQFAHSVTSPEHFFWCGDDEILRSLKLKGLSYGFGASNQLKIPNFRQSGWKIFFDVYFEGKKYHDIEISLVGGHNVLNAAAVFGLGLRLNIPEQKIRNAFSSFQGIGRRAELKGEIRSISFYDDYAHHPTEIFATLRAVKNAIGKRRLVVAFQPHRFTRTRDCLHEFASAFHAADAIILTDIYSAGEPPIEGINTAVFVKKIKESCSASVFYSPRPDLVSFIQSFLEEEDVFITMGAGDITKVGPEVLQRLGT